MIDGRSATSAAGDKNTDEGGVGDGRGGGLRRPAGRWEGRRGRAHRGLGTGDTHVGATFRTPQPARSRGRRGRPTRDVLFEPSVRGRAHVGVLSALGSRAPTWARHRRPTAIPTWVRARAPQWARPRGRRCRPTRDVLSELGSWTRPRGRRRRPTRDCDVRRERHVGSAAAAARPRGRHRRPTRDVLSERRFVGAPTWASCRPTRDVLLERRFVVVPRGTCCPNRRFVARPRGRLVVPRGTCCSNVGSWSSHVGRVVGTSVRARAHVGVVVVSRGTCCPNVGSCSSHVGRVVGASVRARPRGHRSRCPTAIPTWVRCSSAARARPRGRRVVPRGTCCPNVGSWARPRGRRGRPTRDQIAMPDRTAIPTWVRCSSAAARAPTWAPIAMPDRTANPRGYYARARSARATRASCRATRDVSVSNVGSWARPRGRRGRPTRDVLFDVGSWSSHVGRAVGASVRAPTWVTDRRTRYRRGSMLERRSGRAHVGVVSSHAGRVCPNVGSWARPRGRRGRPTRDRSRCPTGPRYPRGYDARAPQRARPRGHRSRCPTGPRTHVGTMLERRSARAHVGVVSCHAGRVCLERRFVGAPTLASWSSHAGRVVRTSVRGRPTWNVLSARRFARAHVGTDRDARPDRDTHVGAMLERRSGRAHVGVVSSHAGRVCPNVGSWARPRYPRGYDARAPQSRPRGHRSSMVLAE